MAIQIIDNKDYIQPSKEWNYHIVFEDNRWYYFSQDKSNGIIYWWDANSKEWLKRTNIIPDLSNSKIIDVSDRF